MGCDIHSFAEKKNGNKYEMLEQVGDFDGRDYGAFGFLAGVRNYSDVKPIQPERGIPADASDGVRSEHGSWGSDAHSASWLSLAELKGFDYDAMMEDKRVTRKTSYGFDGGCTCDRGEGKEMTYREFLGPYFFEWIEKMASAGADRVVFWFDN